MLWWDDRQHNRQQQQQQQRKRTREENAACWVEDDAGGDDVLVSAEDLEPGVRLLEGASARRKQLHLWDPCVRNAPRHT
jgi:hypothetical protein